MKLLKYALTSVIAITLLGCSDGGPSESVVETKVIELVKPKIMSAARDSVELAKSECEPKEEEGVWRCIVSLRAEYKGEEEINTMSYNLKKANGEWFAHGPYPVSRDERVEFEGGN